MRTSGRIAVSLLAIVALIAAVVALRTVTYRAASAVDPSSMRIEPPAAVDASRAAQHLAEAIRIRTVGQQNAADNDWSEWQRMRDWLTQTYPAAHRVMTRELVAEHTLVYTWPGTDPALAPIVLMAHHDVVPVTPGTESNWKHAPFAGVIAEGAVWGRGAVDDKGSLVALFESVEALADAGFKPRRSVILLSGHDEESRGTGARNVAELWRSRGVEPQFALDEGLVVVEDFTLLGRPVALIGIAEKGYATLKVTATAPGGHSSAPPAETGVETLAKAVLAITSNPFALRFDGPAAEMLRTLAPLAKPAARMAIANSWLFEPLLVRGIASTPVGASLLHTTIAPTMLRGSPKENVLPQDATAWINYRIAPGHTAAAVMEHAKAATAGLAVSLAWEQPPLDPSPVSSTTSEAYRLIAAVASDGGTVPVAPGLMTAATDSRNLAGVARDVYRFLPLSASLKDLEMIHGTNEHLTLENLERMTRFYSQLIATAAR